MRIGKSWSRLKNKLRKKHRRNSTWRTAHRDPVRFAVESLEPRRLLSVNVTQFHDDNASDGANTAETILTPANVNTSSFGKLFSTAVDGQVYAQPLEVTGVTITSGVNTTTGAAGVHDVVFVATENDSVYAIDAHSGAVLWYRPFSSITNSGGNVNNTLGATAITALSPNDVESTDISPSIGITGTPVIDTTNNILYVVTKTDDIVNGVRNYVQRLHAINLSNGTDVTTPYMIGDTVNGGQTTQIYVYGNGDGHVTDPYNGTGKQVVQFDALTENQRPALSLVNGNVYVEWASHGDNGPYHGWVVSWNVSNITTGGFALSGVLNTSPNDGEAGIWASGNGLTFEPDGSAFYFSTGNGTGGSPTIGANGLPTDANYNEAVVKAVMDPTTSATNQGPNGWGMKVVDWFIPYNVVQLDAADSDFGSGGVTLLPAAAGIPGHPNLLLAGGKSGAIYLLDRNNLGHFGGYSDAALNSVTNGSGQTTPPVVMAGLLSASAYYNGLIYEISGYSGPAESYAINTNGLLTETSQTPESSLGFEPGSISISADGSTDGIVWVMDRNTNEIHAYSAASLATELWNSAQAAGGTDNLGAVEKFAVPTIANGEVFVGTTGTLVAYGLKAPANAAPNAPVLTAATPLSNSSVNLTWTDSTTAPNTATAYLVQDSTDGVNFSTIATSAAGSNTIAVGGLSAGAQYSFRIIGFNPVGNSVPSNVLTAQGTTATASISFPSGFGANASTLMQFNGSAKISGGALALATNQQNQTGSAWYKTQQNITQFSTSFTFSLTGTWPLANGLTFTIQNDLATAIGVGGAGLGYGDGSATGVGGIPNSVAVKFDVYNTQYTGSTGLYINGAYPAGGNSVELTNYGINLRSYDQMLVNMSYNGAVLAVTLTDLTTNKTETQNYTVNIPAIVGGNNAWVGFTAADGIDTILPQVFNWTYTPASGGGNVTTSPNTPTGLGAAVASATSVNLTWTAASTNQTGYYLDRATDPAFTQNLVTQTLGASPSSFTDSLAGLAPGGTYYYQIRAFNSTGSSGNSNSAAVSIPLAPATATNQAVTLVTANEIDITWQDNAGHTALGYYVLRATNMGTFSLIATLPPTSRTAPSQYGYDDTSVTPGNFYEYHIQAFNISGYNDFAGVNATTLPPAPTGVTASPLNGAITLAWSAANGATGYNVMRAGASGGPYTTIASNISGTTFTDSPLTNGVAYYYVVNAIDATGTGANSSQVSGTPSSAVVTLNYSSGFSGAASSLTVNGGHARISGSSLLLTDNNPSETSSVYATSKQNISSFTTTFGFLVTGSWPLGNGFTFVIQNSAANAMGQGGSGLGYGAASSGNTGGIPNSAAVKFSFFGSQGEGNDSTGLYVNGAAPTSAGSIDLTNSGFNLRSYDPSLATITYDGTTLTVTITDTVTKATATQSYAVNIPALVGGNMAWVGFTASDGSLTSSQTITSWTYTQTAAAPSVPLAPTGVTAVAGNGQATINWAASAGANSYTISYGTTSGGSYTTVLTGISGTSDTIAGLTNGTPYYFVVSAVSGGGTSANSTQATATPVVGVAAPAAPTGLTATAGSGQVVLNWAASSGASSYTVSYGTTNGSAYSTVVTNISGTTTTITGLTNGTPYYFVVSATNTGGTSANSSQATATPVATLSPPTAPTGLTPTAGSGQVALTWTASTGATSYNVMWGLVAGGPYYNVLTGVTGLSQTITGLTNGTAYYFVVAAVGAGGTGANSTQATGTPSGAVSSLNYSSGFGTAGSSIKLNGNAKVTSGNLVLTDNGPSETSSVYATTQQNIASFNTSFTFQITGSWPLGNGFTFVIQNSAVNAIGQGGSGLGYGNSSSGNVGGIPNSIAIKFGVFGSQGEGNDSTGLYVNGAAPTSAGSIDMSSTAFNLRSYDLSTANISYNGTTLTVTLTDTVTKATVTQNYTINIPATIGSGTAWVGFTAADGSLTASQVISAWTFTSTSSGTAPAAPTGAAATAGNGQATINWATSTGATSYNVKYGTTAGGPYTTVLTGFTGTSATIAGLTNSTKYYFVVSAVSSGNESGNSSEVNATPTPPVVAPSAPTGVTATAGNAQVTLNWTAVTGATSYTIQYGTATGVYTTTLTNVSGITDTITNLTNGTAYFFVVEAVNTGGNSANSTEVSTTPLMPQSAPAVPTGLMATAGNGQVVLNWTAAAGATTYTVSYGTTNGSAYNTVVSSISGTTTTITSLNDGTAYYFVVAAVNAAGPSGNSTQATATPALPVAPPSAPTGLSVTAGNAQASLSWTGSSGATSYNIEFGLVSGGPYPNIVNVAGTTDTITGLTNGQTYYFVVTAVNSGGQSSATTEMNATPSGQATTLNYPSGFAGAGSAFTFNGGAAKIASGNLVLTDNGTSETTSIFANAPQNIGSFSTTFGFLITGTWPLANGFTFVIQNSSLTALGQGGSGLGYGAASTGNAGGIPNSIAIKFSTFGSQGEGNDSTGLYVGGAAPTSAGSIDLTNTGFNLRSYDASTATISYDGTTLTVTLTDLVTEATVTQQYAINIPAAVGGSTAWVGFTASDGSLVSSQVISNWTFTSASTGTAPAAPTGVTATAGGGQATINWTAATGATSYNIKYGTTAGGPYTTVLTGLTGTSDTITGLTNNTEYFFVVTAVSSGNESGASSEVNATPIPPVAAPSAPTGVTATAGNAQVTLNWTAVAGANSYTIQYGTATGVYTTTLTNITGTTDTISSLANGTAYFFVVEAVNTGGNSINSTEVSTTPVMPQSAPSAPTGLTATAGNGQVVLNWTASAGATTYNVKYGTTNGGSYNTVLNLVSGTTDTITALTNGTAYYFVVSAVNTGGESANSTQATATPVLPVAPPSAPTGLTATSGNTAVTLNWTVASGATTYNVLYGTTNGSAYGTVINNVNGTTYTVTGLTNGNAYYFVVQAVNSGGASANSTQASSTPSGSTTTLSYPNFTNAASSLKLNGSASISSGNLVLTNNNNSQTSSVYALTQQNVAGFTTTFNFQITGSWPLGNGFTFVIQNSSLTAIGQGGSGLGYGAPSSGNVGGIPNSIAVKFSTFGSQGEGNDATGVYVNGAAPTSAGSIDLSNTGFNLRSYDASTATISYNGTTLTVTLTDTVTKATATQNYTLNIPGIIGSSTGWVGFTASDGSLTSSQIISAWTYTVVAAAPTLPGVPTGVTATAGNGQAVLNWTASTGASTYNILYSTTSGGPYATFQAGVSGTTATVTGLTNGTPYFFVVAAVNSSGTSANSTQATATPAAGVVAPSTPTGLVATAGAGQVSLTWGASAGAVTYIVSYGTTSGGPYGTVINNVTGNSYTASGLTSGTTYYFVVAAVNTAGTSVNSTQASGTPTGNTTSLSFANFTNAASSLKLNGSASISSGSLALTNNSNSQTSSVYALTPQGVGAFTTTFGFQITGSWPLGNGFTFVIQNSSLTAIGQGGSGLGYGAPASGNVGGIPNSVAIKFSTFGSQGEGNDATGLYLNGAAPTSAASIDLSNTGFNLRSYDACTATISYDGTTLTVTLTDTVTKATATQTYAVNIPAIVGSSTAWVGFTASDGSLTSSQIISSWTYQSMAVSTPAPAAPTGVTATAGNAKATVNWTASTGATGYNVSYATNVGGPYTVFQSNVAGTSLAVTGLTNGTPYFFVVSATNAGGTSANSTAATATPSNVVAPPAAPTGLTASVGAGQISLTWSASTGATTYNVKYGTTSGGPYPNELSVTSGTSFTVTGLNNGTNYFFVVSAVSSTAGEGANSTQVSAMPSANLTPMNFPAGFTGDSSQFTFNGSGSARIVGSNLDLTDDNRSEKGSAWFDTQENITSFNTTFDFVINGSWPLGCGFTFAIQGVGLNAIGQGGSGFGYGAATTGGTGGIPDSMAIKFGTFSSEGQGTDCTGLYTDGAAPAILNSIDMTSSGFNLRSYDLSQCTLTYDGTTLTETLTDLVTKATFTTQYTVNIPAIIGSSTAWIGFTGGDGDETSNQYIENWTYQTTPPTAPSAPSGVNATVANDQVTLNWNASVGASSYTVSYGTTSGGPYTTVLAGLTGTTDTITGLTDGTPYFFIVTAGNTFGTSNSSAEVSATPALTAPGTPTGLTATPGDGQVILNWTAPTGGASSYTVSYGTASGVYTQTIANITGTTTTVTGLTDGTPYYFAVAAVNTSGSSTNSVEASATPSPSGPPTSANFGSGFTGQSSAVTVNGAAVLNGANLELLNNNGFEVSSAYDDTPQNIASFSTEFDFQITGTWPIANGFTFVIQDAGLSAIGQGGGGLGYGGAVTGGAGGIADSVAIKFDIFSTQGEGTDSTGLYTDGAAPTNVGSIDLSNSGFNLRSYDLSNCQISYDGATLTETLTDLVTNATVTETYIVNIPQIVGGNTAYLGFTAGDGSEVSLTNITNWTYASGTLEPNAPTNVSATGGSGQIAVNWTAAPGAFSYSISYGQANGGPYPTVVAGILGTSDTISGLGAGQTYYLIVTSFDAFGQSLGSTQVTVTA